MTCPTCQSDRKKRNGFDRHNIRRFCCKDCGKTYLKSEPEKPLGGMYLSLEKARLIVHLLVEGNSVSAAARIAGVHKRTVLSLLVLMGEKCQRILDEKVQNVNSFHIQADELWTFIWKKQKRVKHGDPKEWGDQYCFVGMDSETKLVISHTVGKRTGQTALEFIRDLANRLAEGCRTKLVTDGFKPYIDAVEDAFGADVDYGMLTKLFQGDVEPGRERYSPGGLLGMIKSVIIGRMDEDLISTSYIERQNRTVRMAIRRFTRLVDAFSKKLENLEAACALHFCYYNFCRQHMSLDGCTPAMEAGITDRIWEIEDLIRAA